MIYELIESVLDELGYDNVQDTPIAELQSGAESLFVYTAGDTLSNTFIMGKPIVDMEQMFKIYMVTSDLYADTMEDNETTITLLEVFNKIKSKLPKQTSNSTGSYYITDITDPHIQFSGTNEQSQRIAELHFRAIWSYNYANL